jgi:CDP-glycerol glycerophosphotransferase (TagB/SpsB family)
LFWYIRLHPRYKNQKEEVVSILTKSEITNYEIDKSSTYNLQDLIVISDIHITSFSSTCLDALDLGLKSIIVNQQGKLLYKKQIENGDFYYCNNELDLNKTVRNQVFKTEIDLPDAIDLKTLFN